VLIPVGHANDRELRLEDPQDDEHDAKNGRQSANPPREPRDANAHPRRRWIEFGNARHRRSGPPDPARRRRPRNAEPPGKGDVAGLLDELDEAVVIRAVRAFRSHDPRITPETGKGKTARKSRSTMLVECPTEMFGSP